MCKVLRILSYLDTLTLRDMIKEHRLDAEVVHFDLCHTVDMSDDDRDCRVIEIEGFNGVCLSNMNPEQKRRVFYFIDIISI